MRESMAVMPKNLGMDTELVAPFQYIVPMRSIGQSHLSLTYPINSKYLINKKQLYSIEALVAVLCVLQILGEMRTCFITPE